MTIWVKSKVIRATIETHGRKFLISGKGAFVLHYIMLPMCLRKRILLCRYGWYDVISPVSRLIESLSEALTLEPGDILTSGTPSGVGYAMEPPNFLKPGDKVTCEIEEIGQLVNIVRESNSSVLSE
jgi:2-keto-4-pentenoate hydratase/2-oxohepta-3-ene-1,7-dioic acid hydratase in catechol pathway